MEAEFLNVISKFCLDIFDLDNNKGEMNTAMEKETASVHCEQKHTSLGLGRPKPHLSLKPFLISLQCHSN